MSNLEKRKEAVDFYKFVDWASKNVSIKKKKNGNVVYADIARALEVSKSSLSWFKTRGVPIFHVTFFAQKTGASLDELFGITKQVSPEAEKAIQPQALGEGEEFQFDLKILIPELKDLKIVGSMKKVSK